MRVFLRDEVSQLQGRQAQKRRGPDSDSMHEDFPQQAMAQMPEIFGPHSFERRSVD